MTPGEYRAKAALLLEGIVSKRRGGLMAVLSLVSTSATQIQNSSSNGRATWACRASCQRRRDVHLVIAAAFQLGLQAAFGS